MNPVLSSHQKTPKPKENYEAYVKMLEEKIQALEADLARLYERKNYVVSKMNKNLRFVEKKIQKINAEKTNFTSLKYEALREIKKLEAIAQEMEKQKNAQAEQQSNQG